MKFSLFDLSLHRMLDICYHVPLIAVLCCNLLSAIIQAVKAINFLKCIKLQPLSVNAINKGSRLWSNHLCRQNVKETAVTA